MAVSTCVALTVSPFSAVASSVAVKTKRLKPGRRRMAALSGVRGMKKAYLPAESVETVPEAS